MESNHLAESRSDRDRRSQPTSAWNVWWRGGRRQRPRRLADRKIGHFVDHIDTPTFVLAVLLVLLTLVDGAATLVLLGSGCEEVNPAMSYLLQRGPLYFLLGKYTLTASCLPFLLIFRKFPIFQTELRVGHLLPVFVGLYLVLLGYQIALLSHPLPEVPEFAADEF